MPTDLSIAPTAVALHARVPDRAALIALGADLLARAYGGPRSGNLAACHEALLRRERRGSTQLGFGWALPHACLPGLGRPCLALVRCAQPLPGDGPDGRSLHSALFLLVPRWAAPMHHDLLTRLQHGLARPAARAALETQDDVHELCWALRRLSLAPAEATASPLALAGDPVPA